MSGDDRLPVLVIGAGPAGLATSAELRRHGIEHTVFERGDRVGYTWSQLYDSLVLHTGKHMSALPGMPFPSGTPLFPTRQHFVDYLATYAQANDVPLQTGKTVRLVARDGYGWIAHVGDLEIRTHALVIATGILSNPRVPTIPGRDEFRGRVEHSVSYRNPEPYRGRRVLVVGVGNSGGEIAIELGRAGATVTVAVRSGANVVPRTLAGVPIQYIAYYLRKLPRGAQNAIVGAVRKANEIRRGPPPFPRSPAHPLDAVPLIGFHLVDAIREGKVRVQGGVAAFTSSGVRFLDGSEEAFDDVILATGYQPALGPLGGLVQRDEKGFALRSDRVTSADQPGLFFVGHNYDSTGGLQNIAVDSRIVGERLAAVKDRIRTLVSGAWKRPAPTAAMRRQERLGKG